MGGVGPVYRVYVTTLSVRGTRLVVVLITKHVHLHQSLRLPQRAGTAPHLACGAPSNTATPCPRTTFTKDSLWARVKIKSGCQTLALALHAPPRPWTPAPSAPRVAY